jgi:predicted glycosyltransferase
LDHGLYFGDGVELMHLGAPGVMFYSHDTYGLGHLRRTLLLAGFLRSRRPLSQLIVTGSALAHRFRFPPGTDYIKLPSVVKVAAGRYEPRFLGLSFEAIRELRRDLLLGAARHFQPRLLIVDNVPSGLKRELVPTLELLKSSSCRLVLGLRDIVDEPRWVRHAWAQDGSYELLDSVYDQIVIYGERELYDPVSEYGFSPAAAAKTRFVGYLRREPPRSSPGELREALGIDSKHLVLIMAGGGEDGYHLMRSVLEAIRFAGGGSRFECVLLGGPLMPVDQRAEVLARAHDRSIRYIDFVDDVASYVEAADAVVSMGGYNSVCELLSLGKPALIVPRVSPRREQLIRARILSDHGLVRMLHPTEVEPARLLRQIEKLLENGRRPTLPMNGLPAAAEAVDELLDQSARDARLVPVGA